MQVYRFLDIKNIKMEKTVNISNKDGKKRIPYLDVAKAICIFLMVVGHHTTNETLLIYIYSFHMPALFAISGILYKPRSWIKTILSFGIPVAFYSLLNLIYLLVISEIKINQVFTKELLFRFFHYRYGLGDGLFMGDWFIWALIALRLLWGDIHLLGFIRKYFIYITIFTIIYMTFESHLITIEVLSRGYFWGRAIPSLPFFCMGLYIKNKKWDPKEMPNYHLIFIIPIVILIMINGYCSINENEYGFSYLIFYLTAICSTIFLFKIASYIRESKAITIISKGTLLILGLHIPILNLLEMIFPSYTYEILPAFVLLICYYPIQWLDRWCPELLGRIRWNI